MSTNGRPWLIIATVKGIYSKLTIKHSRTTVHYRGIRVSSAHLVTCIKCIASERQLGTSYENFSVFFFFFSFLLMFPKILFTNVDFFFLFRVGKAQNVPHNLLNVVGGINRRNIRGNWIVFKKTCYCCNQ